jgi:hypothetical protein
MNGITTGVNTDDFSSFSVLVADTSGVTFQWAFNGNNIADNSGSTDQFDVLQMNT